MGRAAVAALTAAWVIPISILVNRDVPDPYMDEIFHVPQAQRYCRGDFGTWDPMITTPPGLYYLSLAFAAFLFPAIRVVTGSRSFSDVCSTAVLRSMNGVIAVICGVLLYDLLVQLRPNLGDRKATLCASLLALYPLHWFFTFLYYTDVASLAAVLAMYLACLKGHYRASAMLGGLSILFRQTNVVWVMLVAANGGIKYVRDFSVDGFSSCEREAPKETSSISSHKKGVNGSLTMRRGRLRSSANIPNLFKKSTAISGGVNASGFFVDIFNTGLKLWSLKWEVLKTFSPFVFVVLAFATFIIWNGSIVLGAKEAHPVSPHFAQLLYFGLFSIAALAPVHLRPHIITSIWMAVKGKVLNSFLALGALMIGFAMVHSFSIAHPYLLADNRHYPFYIWRKIIQAHWAVKYLLVPFYVYSWSSIISALGKSQERIWVVSFLVACSLVLVPALLIEFRYYTIPFYFVVLHSHTDDNVSWLLLAAMYMSVNLFTMGMFLFRPFHWDHEPGTQRFIW